MLNKAFKSDSQRLAVSLRSSIAKRRSHLNAALTGKMEMPKASEQKEFANVSLWAMPSFRKS
ncbi:hypothetical protein VCHE48_3970 [Vibrio cholerae HE48]|nr:hypothetical protein VCHE48_3970 [Vibrio cholerae HE48]